MGMIRYNHEWHVAAVPAPLGPWGWTPCMRWCTETFGDECWQNSTNGRWRYNTEGVFEFKNAEDCEWFLLRWS